MRINQFLAKCGLGSRRSVEKLIDAGRVKLNGQVVDSFGVQVDPLNDQVLFDGQLLALKNETEDTWIYHKPRGSICTRHDPEKRKTIYDDLAHLPPPYQAAGRLDFESRGLMVISRHGELIEQLIHPRYEVQKIYEVVAKGSFNSAIKEQLANGVEMREGGIGKALTLKHQALSSRQHALRLLLKRGKKREIRYSLQALGLSVLDLFRVQIGSLTIGSLRAGESRPLSEKDKRKLFEQSC